MFSRWKIRHARKHRKKGWDCRNNIFGLKSELAIELECFEEVKHHCYCVIKNCKQNLYAVCSMLPIDVDLCEFYFIVFLLKVNYLHYFQ